MIFPNFLVLLCYPPSFQAGSCRSGFDQLFCKLLTILQNHNMSYFSRGDRIFGKYVLSLVTCCILYVNIDFARQLSCLWAISINFCMQYLKETLFSTCKINCYITNIDITLCFSLFLDFAVLQFTRKYYFCRAD